MKIVSKALARLGNVWTVTIFSGKRKNVTCGDDILR